MWAASDERLGISGEHEELGMSLLHNEQKDTRKPAVRLLSGVIGGWPVAGHASAMVVALEPRPSTRTHHVIVIDSGEVASATASPCH